MTNMHKSIKKSPEIHCMFLMKIWMAHNLLMRKSEFILLLEIGSST